MTPGDPYDQLPQEVRDRLACLEMEMRENIVDFRPDILEQLDSDE